MQFSIAHLLFSRIIPSFKLQIKSIITGQIVDKSLILLQFLHLAAKNRLIHISDLECVISALPNMSDTVHSGLATVTDAVTFI